MSIERQHMRKARQFARDTYDDIGLRTQWFVWDVGYALNFLAPFFVWGTLGVVVVSAWLLICYMQNPFSLWVIFEPWSS